MDVAISTLIYHLRMRTMNTDSCYPWKLISSRGMVLIYVANNPKATIREISTAIDLTQSRVMDILKDLKGAKLLSTERQGRRRVYTIHPDGFFVHPDVHVRLADFLDLATAATPGGGPWHNSVADRSDRASTGGLTGFEFTGSSPGLRALDASPRRGLKRPRTHQ